MSDIIKKRIKAAHDLYSTAYSKVRQPIEALFGSLIQKINIQKGSLVRSTKGLHACAYLLKISRCLY